jgi:hypothetical protein
MSLYRVTLPVPPPVTRATIPFTEKRLAKSRAGEDAMVASLVSYLGGDAV